jgi:hypothetical protein
VTIVAGMGNAVLGALLIHDLKDESYLNWLLPACILIGLVAIAAIGLEAFKLQVGGFGGRWTAFVRVLAFTFVSGCCVDVCVGGGILLSTWWL